jgi:hypothetical protein
MLSSTMFRYMLVILIIIGIYMYLAVSGHGLSYPQSDDSDICLSIVFIISTGQRTKQEFVLRH